MFSEGLCTREECLLNISIADHSNLLAESRGGAHRSFQHLDRMCGGASFAMQQNTQSMCFYTQTNHS